MGNFPLALRRPGCTLPCEHGPWRTGALRGGRPTSWRPCPHTLSTSRTCIRRLNCSILLDTNVVSLMHCVTRCFGRCLINVGDSWIAGPQPCTQQTTCIARHRTPGNHVATCSTTSSTSVDSGRLQENTISVVYTAGKRARSWVLCICCSIRAGASMTCKADHSSFFRTRKAENSCSSDQYP